MKILLYPHGGSVNHGCEAIIRTTAEFIKNNKITLLSGDKKSDDTFGLTEIVDVVGSEKFLPVKNNSFTGLKNRVKAKLFKKDIDELMLFSKYKAFSKFDFVISIGGDNYCYLGMIQVLSGLNKTIDYYKIPRVLYGCSFDEKLLSDSVINELKGYKAIIVRESVSQKILFDCGINDNVFLFPDPAFTLSKKDVKFPIEDFGKNGVIGLNLSPLMGRYMSEDVLSQNYISLVDYILENTNKNVLLIPHVNQGERNSDFTFMKKVFGDRLSDRVCLLDDTYDCMQLKGFISQCEAFVGCRTHATIAAYSTCVPTLVVGYSNKSKGIAKDIFGENDNYIIPGDKLKNENDLTEEFKSLYNKREQVKKYLVGFMPSYIEKAKAGGEKLNEIINRKK